MPDYDNYTDIEQVCDDCTFHVIDSSKSAGADHKCDYSDCNCFIYGFSVCPQNKWTKVPPTD